MSDERQVVLPSYDTRVLLLGHSYIKRLYEYAEMNDVRSLQLNANRLDMRYMSLPGATLAPGRKCINEIIDDARSLQPDIVYVHIGELDIINGTRYYSIIQMLLR